jgi:hypothetical protein
MPARPVSSFGEFEIAATRFGRNPKACCSFSSTGFDFSGAEAMV